MDETAKKATPVRPQDDLYRHINGEWLAATTIPEDRPIHGSFYVLRDSSEERCRDLIEDCVAGRVSGDEASLIARLYSAFMDTDAIEAAGIRDLEADLEAIAAAPDKRTLARLLGQFWRVGVGGWFGVGVTIDTENPDVYTAAMGQDGISLPDEVYYFAPEYGPIRQAFVAHVARMFTLAGVDHAALRAARVFEIERGFASFHLDSVRLRDVDLTTNFLTFAQVAADSSGFAWDAWAEGARLDLDRIDVSWPSFVAAGARWWSLAPLADIKTWITWRLIHRYSAYLPAAFVDETFDFYSRTLAGTKTIRERWKRGVGVIESHLGFALGRLFVSRHFPASSRQQMIELVDTLLAAYRSSISQLTWMGEATRQRALAKLEQFRAKIGYPERGRTYEDVTFSEADSLIDLVRASCEADTDFETAKIGRPVDRDEWLMTPQTVNAYYYPPANEIVFPAAILQPPFYSPDATDAQNYGGIGAVIGHEIGHGFDDQGAKFDGTGRLNNWWDKADFEEFTARTKALIAQYDSYVPEGLDAEEHVNGALTIGENIGDLGGLSISLKAWRIARERAGEAAPSAEEVREFFFQWARIWRTKAREEMARQLLVIDPHSPAEFRCNGVVRNVDAFHEAFATSPEDDLWLAPDARVSIW